MAMRSSSPAGELTVEEHFEVAQFLYREAQLLDDRRYLDWFGVLAEDVEYRVPLRSFRQSEGVEDDWAVEKELSAPDDLQLTVNRYAQMKIRVDRLLSGRAHTENPPWFTQRLITNVDARRGSVPGEFEVASKFLLNRFKAGREQTIVGSRKDTLLRAEGEFRISRRWVLYNADSYRWGAYVLI
jgi:3-phenylpropionate/cinnamic acid dioxygenase small subunit